MMTIRAAKIGEAIELTSIALAAKRHWGYPDEDLELWKDELTITDDYIDANVVVCAERSGVPVGFYAIGDGEAGLELDLLFVQPAHMRRGVGDALLRHAMECARQNGAAALRIVSDPYAEGFYVRYGARRVGVVPSRPEGRELPLLRLPL